MIKQENKEHRGRVHESKNGNCTAPSNWARENKKRRGGNSMLCVRVDFLIIWPPPPNTMLSGEASRAPRSRRIALTSTERCYAALPAWHSPVHCWVATPLFYAQGWLKCLIFCLTKIAHKNNPSMLNAGKKSRVINFQTLRNHQIIPWFSIKLNLIPLNYFDWHLLIHFVLKCAPNYYFFK